MISVRSLLSVACMGLLAACSSGNSTIYEKMAPLVANQILGGGLFGGDEPAAAVPAREMTRAELNQIPFATIALTIDGNPRAFVVPVADNAGYLVYQDPARRGVVMRGGLITATHGFGYDMDAVAHRRNDPVAEPTPLPEWPATVERSYAFSIRGIKQYEIGVACTYERGVREFVEIVELRFEVVRMVETCRNPQRTFVNTYWVAPESGFIWKSEQWIGPRLSPVTLEIIRPYGGQSS